MKYPKEKYPKISVILGVKNGVKTIAKALDSALAQNYPNVELVVIDGLSTDGTQTVIERYKDHIAYFVSEKDRSAAEAINKGVDRSNGEIICQLNADDWYEPNTFFKVAETFIENPEVEMVNFDGKLVYQENGELKIKENIDNKSLFTTQDSIPDIYPNCRMMKRGLIERYRMIEIFEDGKSLVSNDWEQMVRMVHDGVKNISIDHLGYIYLAHEGSATYSGSLKGKYRLWEERAVIAEKFLKDKNKNFTDNVLTQLKVTAIKGFSRAFAWKFWHGDISKSLNYFVRGCKSGGLKFLKNALRIFIFLPIENKKTR